MKIACNYYPETEQLLDEGKIELDYFKYPSLGFQMGIMKDLEVFEAFCRTVVSKRPILLHGLYPAPHDLASPTLQTDFDNVTAQRLLAMTRAPGLSFHPALRPLPTSTSFGPVLETIIGNARFIQQRYAHLSFVSLENGDNLEWGALLQPENMTRLVEESGCGFLLDISHAYCAARLLDVPFYDYLRRLPLDKTAEIHINGWIVAGSDVMCHTKIHEKGYQALEFVLEHCTPQVITVEYGRPNDRIDAGVVVMQPDKVQKQAKNEIEEQVYKIQEICHKKGI